MAFVVQVRIGRGRTVETFAGRLEVGGETMDVAVKRPRPEFANNEAFLGALVEWGNKQKEVEFDDIVAVLEAGRAESAYVIQERVRGASLAQVLEALRRRKRTIMLPLALRVAERIAGALAHLHERKIVHGGLDPSEVQISYEGDVKLGDQEIHRLDIHCSADLSDHGREPSMIYRAPELAPEKARPTFSSDTYALALMMLEMLIGHAVWNSPQMTVEASVAALKDFTHVGQAQAALTQDLVEILALCTDKDPVNRVPSGKELSAGLRRVIAQHGIAADDGALGSFVKALIPVPRAEEAPTQLHDPARVSQFAKEGETVSIIEVDSASVAIDPDVERKALARTQHLAGRSLSFEPKLGSAGVAGVAEGGAVAAAAVAGPVAAGAAAAAGAATAGAGAASAGGPGAAGGAELAAAPSPAAIRTPALVPAAGAHRAAGPASGLASQAAQPSPFPGAGFSQISKVAEAAARASEQTERRPQWQLYAGFLIVGLIVALMIAHMATRGTSVRMVQVTANSIPTGADLYLDNQLVGKTPLAISFAVAHGKVKLRFELPGHEPYEALVETQQDALRYEALLRPLSAAPRRP